MYCMCRVFYVLCAIYVSCVVNCVVYVGRCVRGAVFCVVVCVCVVLVGCVCVVCGSCVCGMCGMFCLCRVCIVSVGRKRCVVCIARVV